MSGCTICGSGAVRQRELADGRVQHLCRAHEYACAKHLKDPCPICDGGEPDPDDSDIHHLPTCRPEHMTKPDEEGIRDCASCGLWEYDGGE